MVVHGQTFTALPRPEERRRVEYEDVENLERQAGVGLVGKLMDRHYRRSRLNTEIRFNLADVYVYRPYFTVWVTSIQIIIFIVTISVYGIAPVSVQKVRSRQVVIRSNMVYENVSHDEESNMWIGPRPRDLILLGAKFSSCMRRDPQIEAMVTEQYDTERGSACCIYNDKSGCVQTISDDNNICSKLLAVWKKNPDIPGTVCGLDPQFCQSPSNLTGAWKNDITEWPICRKKLQTNEDYMTCNIIGKPCCVGVSGECVITTSDYCEFLHGYFHPEAFLCSQVSCMSALCGMVPFANPNVPDQGYRLIISQFIHSGLLDLLLTILLQATVMRDLEKLIGWIRISIIYILSGLVGSLASATFLPYDIGAGPTGSHFGILACLFIEVVHNWYIIRNPLIQILKLSGYMMILFLIGLLPMVDNYAHVFGFLFGLLLAFAMMPFITFNVIDRRFKLIGVAVCLSSSIVIIVLLLLVFYVAPIRNCNVCKYFNCVPFTSTFCDSSEMTLQRLCNITDVTCK